MTPKRRDELLAAARGLGPEDYNRLVESVGATRVGKRLRYWQEELLARLAVGPVSFEEFVAAFEGAERMRVPRHKPAVEPPEGEPPEPELHHPRLGGLYRDDEEGSWEGAIQLPRFAPGEEWPDEDGSPPGFVRIRIEDPDRAGVSPQQDAALAHLLAREEEVFDAVSRELGIAFDSDEPAGEFLCTAVEVARLHLGGIAYLGFFLPDLDPEHGFMVVYHPTKGTLSGDWEALSLIEEADNL
jgi:hypothetical protein